MQIIIPFKGSPEDYVRNCEHLQVICPVVCPNCQGEGCLRKHGYYSRSVSTGECARLIRVLIIVRRFLCCLCRLTTSTLPPSAHRAAMALGLGTQAQDILDQATRLLAANPEFDERQ